MNGQPRRLLLTPNDPPPVRVFNPKGRASFLLIGDHAGNAIPSRLGTLGIDDAERARHIAWDIGIGALGLMLAKALDAAFIYQPYSRLVIDCNRDPAAADAIAEVSDGTPIPGNCGLRLVDWKARLTEIHEPYHQAIAAELARRDAAERATVLVALHSFTPAMGGRDRPWQIGILHDRGDTAFAEAMLQVLQARGDLVVGDNEPYAMDGIDYTIPRHAYPERRPYVELEIRQDPLASAQHLKGWSQILAVVLPVALRERRNGSSAEGAVNGVRQARP